MVSGVQPIAFMRTRGDAAGAVAGRDGCVPCVGSTASVPEAETPSSIAHQQPIEVVARFRMDFACKFCDVLRAS